ncbi:TPA: helix-turn-helix domain-containing protein [Listeria monocytogenes]
MTETSAVFLRSIREKFNYNQYEIGTKVLGVSDRQVKRIESGKVDLSVNQLLRIIDFFELDLISIMKQLSENNNKHLVSEIQRIYMLAKDPMCNSEQVLDKIEILLQDETINYFHQLKLLSVQSLINFRETNDYNYLNYFVNHLDTNNIDDIELLHLSLCCMDNDQIITYLKSLNKKKLQKHAEKMTRIFINALGILVYRKYRDPDLIVNLYIKTKKIIIKEKEFFILPILYFHGAMFYKSIGANEKYLAAKSDAMTLARIYENDQLLFNIKNEVLK